MTLQPAVWLTEQQKQQRQLLLIIDTVAAPNAVAMLFKHGPIRDYIRLFKDTEFESLLEHSPWLVRLDDSSVPALKHLLEAPERNWGWVASATHLDLNEVAQHWRDRMLISEAEQRWFYRFQDNVVIARHLSALSEAQIPLLLGPLNAALCWDGEHWQSVENNHPAVCPPPFATPWLEVPETPVASRTIQIRAIENWLWKNHPDATFHLPMFVKDWVKQQLDLAAEWEWHEAEQILFLVEHQLDPESAQHAAWAKQQGETAEAHFARVQRAFAALDARQATQ